MTVAILGPCPHCCGEGVIWRSRYGGNDPDVWSVPCPGDCDDGEVTAMCDTCPSLATVWREGQWYCDPCLKDASE